jgi:hypothetical protein
LFKGFTAVFRAPSALFFMVYLVLFRTFAFSHPLNNEVY